MVSYTTMHCDSASLVFHAHFMLQTSKICKIEEDEYLIFILPTSKWQRSRLQVDFNVRDFNDVRYIANNGLRLNALSKNYLMQIHNH